MAKPNDQIPFPDPDFISSSKTQSQIEPSDRAAVMAQWAEEDRLRAQEERARRIQAGDSEFLWHEHLNKTKPHHERDEVVSARPLTTLDGFHIVKTINNGVVKHHILIDDGYHSTLMGEE